MTFKPDEDYWIEIPAGRYTVGLTPEEARALAQQSAAWIEHKGVDYSLNLRKMMMRTAIMLDTTGNPAWVERYLLDTYPAREVELPAYAIARRPISNREYRQFMADTGETLEPKNWGRDPGNSADELPARGLPWWGAVGLAEWAGARLPFGDEWERAMRGSERRLFPWGNQFDPLGSEIDIKGYEFSVPSGLSRGPNGIEGGLTGSEEWCADLYPGNDLARMTAGRSTAEKIVPACICRTELGYGYWQDTACVRLVRADARSIQPPSPATPACMLAVREVHALDSHIVRPVIAALSKGEVGEYHKIIRDVYHDMPPEEKVLIAALGGADSAAAWIPDEWIHSEFFVAASRETIRRIPPEHGLFAWNMQYRLDKNGEPRARPVVAFRMAYDGAIHRFENRFRADEPDTRVKDITADMVYRSILDAFQYYEAYADSDVAPRK